MAKFNQNAYDDIIAEMAKKYNVSPGLIKQVIQTESSFNPNAASGTGPVGLMQISKALAKDYGYSNEDRLDPRKNIEMGARYLKANLDAFGGDTRKALYGYNQGTGAAKQYFAGKRPASKEGLNYINNPNFQGGNESVGTEGQYSPNFMLKGSEQGAPTAQQYIVPKAAMTEKPAIAGGEAASAATQGDQKFDTSNLQRDNAAAATNAAATAVNAPKTQSEWDAQDKEALAKFKKDQNMNRLSKFKDIADTLQTVAGSLENKSPGFGGGSVGSFRSSFNYRPDQSMIQRMMTQQYQDLYQPKQINFFGG